MGITFSTEQQQVPDQDIFFQERIARELISKNALSGNVCSFDRYFTEPNNSEDPGVLFAQILSNGTPKTPVAIKFALSDLDAQPGTDPIDIEFEILRTLNHHTAESPNFVLYVGSAICKDFLENLIREIAFLLTECHKRKSDDPAGEFPELIGRLKPLSIVANKINKLRQDYHNARGFNSELRDCPISARGLFKKGGTPTKPSRTQVGLFHTDYAFGDRPERPESERPDPEIITAISTFFNHFHRTCKESTYDFTAEPAWVLKAIAYERVLDFDKSVSMTLDEWLTAHYSDKLHAFDVLKIIFQLLHAITLLGTLGIVHNNILATNVVIQSLGKSVPIHLGEIQLGEHSRGPFTIDTAFIPKIQAFDNAFIVSRVPNRNNTPDGCSRYQKCNDMAYHKFDWFRLLLSMRKHLTIVAIQDDFVKLIKRHTNPVIHSYVAQAGCDSIGCDLTNIKLDWIDEAYSVLNDAVFEILAVN